MTAVRRVERPEPIRHGSLYIQRPPMSEARRYHIFGRLVPMDVRELQQQAGEYGEPGILQGALIWLGGVSAIVATALVVAVVVGAWAA